MFTLSSAVEGFLDFSDRLSCPGAYSPYGYLLLKGSESPSFKIQWRAGSMVGIGWKEKQRSRGSSAVFLAMYDFSDSE